MNMSKNAEHSIEFLLYATTNFLLSFFFLQKMIIMDQKQSGLNIFWLMCACLGGLFVPIFLWDRFVSQKTLSDVKFKYFGILFGIVTSFFILIS